MTTTTTTTPSLNRASVLFVLVLSHLFFQWSCCCAGLKSSAMFAYVSKPTRQQHHKGRRLSFCYGLQQKQRCSTEAFSVLSSTSEDDNNNVVADPRSEFLEAMESFKFPNKGGNGDFQKQHRKPQQNDPLMGYRPEQLEAYAESLLSDSSQFPRGIDSKQKNETTTDDKDNRDSVLFLNDDVYRRQPDFSSGKTDDADESLLNDSTIMDQNYREALQNYLEMVVTTHAPGAYDSAADSATSASTVEDLRTFLGQRGVPTFDPVAAETLHRQVFQEEAGHLEQSEAFRASLIDSTAAQQIAAERRGRNYRERQEEVIRELEQQIREFEATTLPTLPQSPPSLPADGRANQPQQSKQIDDVYAELPPRQPSSASSFSRRTNYPRSEASRQSVKIASGSSSSQQLQQQQRRNPLASVRSSGMHANRTIPPSTPQQRPDSGSAHQRLASISNNETETATATLAGSHNSEEKGPWRAVEDPDTNEVFYWNEDTEEMRWEPVDEVSDG